MSFTTIVKDELCTKNGTKDEEISILSGFIRNNGILSHHKLLLTSENKHIIDKIKKDIEEIYRKEVILEEIANSNFSKKKLYQLSTKEDSFLEDISYYDNHKVKLGIPKDYIISSESLKKSYIQGVFLTAGSVNDPKTSRYHLELFIENKEEAVLIQKLLNEYELNAKILGREKGYMIYIKEAEKISDFLKILEVNRAVLYYEDVRIYRDKKNQTNRLNNCEQANMDKIIKSGEEQLEQIALIEEADCVNLLGEKEQIVMEYRKKYPETSLQELAEIISIETEKKITKSGLNHRFRKIKDLAIKIEKQRQRER